MIYIGIDPGLTGAIAVIDATDGEIQLLNMPVMANVKAAERGRKRTHVDPHALTSLLLPFPNRQTRVFLEYTQAGMKGALANYSLGHSSGIIMGVLAALGFSYELVRPQDWKKEFDLLKTQKDCSRTMAQQLFSFAKLSLKKDEGKAEALLVAEWGRRKHSRMID